MGSNHRDVWSLQQPHLTQTSQSSSHLHRVFRKTTCFSVRRNKSCVCVTAWRLDANRQPHAPQASVSTAMQESSSAFQVSELLTRHRICNGSVSSHNTARCICTGLHYRTPIARILKAKVHPQIAVCRLVQLCENDPSPPGLSVKDRKQDFSSAASLQKQPFSAVSRRSIGY